MESSLIFLWEDTLFKNKKRMMMKKKKRQQQQRKKEEEGNVLYDISNFAYNRLGFIVNDPPVVSNHVSRRPPWRVHSLLIVWRS